MQKLLQVFISITLQKLKNFMKHFPTSVKPLKKGKEA